MKGIRRRYLALEIDDTEMTDSREFMNAVWNAVVKLYGEYGASKTGLTLIDYDAKSGFAVIRTLHSAVRMVRTALATITRIEDRSTAIHVLKVSGTIKSLYGKA